MQCDACTGSAFWRAPRRRRWPGRPGWLRPGRRCARPCGGGPFKPTCVYVECALFVGFGCVHAFCGMRLRGAARKHALTRTPGHLGRWRRPKRRARGGRECGASGLSCVGASAWRREIASHKHDIGNHDSGLSGKVGAHQPLIRSVLQTLEASARPASTTLATPSCECRDAGRFNCL